MNRANSLHVAIAATLVAAGLGCTGAPDAGNDPDRSEAVAREVGPAVVESGGVIATLTAPLARALEDDGTPLAVEDGPVAAAANGGLVARIEAAIGQLVDRFECVSLSWSLLRATVQFDDCRIPETNATLNGAMTVIVRPLRRAVTITADDITVGQSSFHGSMTAYLRGPIDNLTVGVDADMTLAGSDATLIVDGLSVEASLDGVTIAGAGSVVSPVVDAAAAADQLHWALGQCAPSGGTVTYSQGLLSGTIRFLETTPATGEVELQIPPLPPQTIEMFPPCS